MGASQEVRARASPALEDRTQALRRAHRRPGGVLDASTPSSVADARVADASVADSATFDAAPLDANVVPAPDAGDSGQATDAVVTDATPPVLDGGAEGGSASPDAGSDAGPVGDAGAADYAARGPHQVTIEKNVGASHRNNVGDDTALCNLFISLVGGSNPDVTRELTTYPSDMERGLYTLFRPAQLEPGKKYPLLTWGNGTCSHPLLFNELLEHVASHGFIIIASNSRWVGDAPVMTRGIDFMLAENQRQGSPYFGAIDPQAVGAFGHSQGSMATVVAGADRRVVATVPIQGASAADARQLRGPTFMIAGEKDTIVSPSGIRDAYTAATVPAVYGLSMGQDHLMPGLDPSKIWDAVVGWFKIHLVKDEAARSMFYGPACKLCNDPRWQLQRKNL
jgi:pimeloyl-ACP methyl ester carboxylesterase